MKLDGNKKDYLNYASINTNLNALSQRTRRGAVDTGITVLSAPNTAIC